MIPTGEKFYISDLHIGHKAILAFDNRPFFNLKEMHEAIIKNWNRVVTKDDLVYVLGDMFWDNSYIPEIMSQLNGTKFLIKGNHDQINSDYRKYFKWVKDYAIIKDGENHIVLCHFPIAHWQNADYGYIHLYGHIHNGRDNETFEEYKQLMQIKEKPYRCWNVGCMLHDYTPMTLEQLMKG